MQHRKFRPVWVLLILGFCLAAVTATAADTKVLVGEKERLPEKPGDNFTHHRRATSDINDPISLPLHRAKPWSLPDQALAEAYDTTIHCLVLRYDFQYETTDDPNTTGRGSMDLSQIITSQDSADYYASVGHWIDAPPHDSAYFDAHMRALDRYWEYVSNGHIHLTWDIYPKKRDSVYQLPREMSHYGRCNDSIIAGLEYYFVDCINIADADTSIDFSKYGAIFLFHAGSDRQNDIGFPPTCSDLFTGFIKFGDSVATDYHGDITYVREALMMPETTCQDNRATALNAVMAHEFGHQLGLVDLYNTANFLSLLGDFALMDDNGFGTGINFGFTVGQVFGAIPLYASAWSRAYLGFDPVYDFREGTNIPLAAAEMHTNKIKIARIPISENEYYLLENRAEEINGIQTDAIADKTTGVILGPGYFYEEADTIVKVPTGEYDFLLPGSGMLIYRVDEGVAALDYTGDGQNNFEDNTLQWDPDRPFIKLMEADGLVNFGGFYRSGFGEPEDMFRDDRNNKFTPNTNPQAVDNTGNNTHVYVTNIRRDSVILPGVPEPERFDTLMYFDVATDKLVENFPVRAGYPSIPLSPVVDDLNGDGTPEIIVVSGRYLNVATSEGGNYLHEVMGGDTVVIDTAYSSVGIKLAPMPLFAAVRTVISAGPVTGDFGTGGEKYVAVGYPEAAGRGYVNVFSTTQLGSDGLALIASGGIARTGAPIALSFGPTLDFLTDSGYVYHQTGLLQSPTSVKLDDEEYHGICRVGQQIAVLAGDSTKTNFHYIGDAVYTFSVDGRYNYGPIVADFNRDGQPEVAAFSEDGDGIYVTVDTTNTTPSFSVLAERRTGHYFTVNPVASDVDLDGYPDVLIGGTDTVFAFNRELILVADFPLRVDDRFPDGDIVSAVVSADIDGNTTPEIIFPTSVGNMYSFGLDKTYGFPLSAGDLGVGSPVVFHDSTGGKLGYLGVDGWFYAWEVDLDTAHALWTMGGHDPEGSYALDQAELTPVVQYADKLPKDKFFVYPNPVTDGQATLRYFLGENADKVTLSIYDFSGYEVGTFDGTATGGVDNEFVWECGGVTPGVYRCILRADFGGDTQTAFADIAVIR